MAIRNNCSPSSIYGAFTQTLFLGCSVMNFSCSQGWNEQQSELTVQLVQDTCAGHTRTYWDSSLNQQTTTAADPGFVGLSYPIIGAPVSFRFGEDGFRFNGLVQSWEERDAVNGMPTYQVKVVDPRTLLEHSHIIINEYAGAVGGLYNLINAYGYMESFGVACPPIGNPVDGTIFGSPAGAFGGADANDNGMQWNQILVATQSLLNGVAHPLFSPYGHLAFKAPVAAAGGMGLMTADVGGLAYYRLDMSEVPIAPSYWRLNGVSTPILDAISQVCKDAGHDYYVDLLFVDGVKHIKVQTVDRGVAPPLNSIDSFIGSFTDLVVENHKGRELRNEPTSAFVIGGPKQSFYQTEQSTDPEGDGNPDPIEADDVIIPFFGLDPNTGNVFVPTKNADGWWEIEMSTVDLAYQLSNPKYNKALAASLTIDERELIAASKDFNTWSGHASTHTTDLWTAIGIGDNKAALFLLHILPILEAKHPDDAVRAADVIHATKAAFPGADIEAAQHSQEISQIAYAWIKKIADTYYGKQFQVRVPFTCGRLDTESLQILTSEKPTDGGWTEFAPVLLLAHPSLYTDFFTLSDNRLGAFCRFNGANGLELTNVDINDFVTTNGFAWFKLGVEQDFVYLDKDTLFSPRAIVTLSQPIRAIKNKDDDVDFPRFAQGLLDLITKFQAGEINAVDMVDDFIALHKHAGNMSGHISGHHKALVPDAAGFGIQSNVLTYGPWGVASTAVGGVNVTHDEGLVPWEYGGFTVLNAAGQATALEGITLQQVAEEGSVTVAGAPTRRLGTELTTGTVTNGAIITNIEVSHGEGGVTTRYDIRTWSPKYGKFLRGNAERLKNVGQLNLRFNKQLRAFAMHRLQQQKLALFNVFAGERNGIDLPKGFWGDAASPHEIFVASLGKWAQDGNNYRRSFVSSGSVQELAVELDGYEQKAYMSLDGLIRGVSMDGWAGLPPYAVPDGHCQTTKDRGAQPPTDKEGEEGEFNQYNLQINVDYLNPFSNPTGKARNLVTVNRSDTPNHGHDIEIVGRTGEPPASSMFMPIEGYGLTQDFNESDHRDDYSMLALRGPLLMQGWGYDLDGFPIPNKVDTEADAAQGIFEPTGLECKFMDYWLRKSHTWPVGPVDLRWDRARAVWTIPQFRHVVAQLKENICPYGSGIAEQVGGAPTYDCDGQEFTPRFVVYDMVGHECLRSGENIIAEYDPYDCRYMILERGDTLDDGVSGSGSSGLAEITEETESIFKFRLLECACINFAHREEGYARAMKLRWNCITKQYEDDYELNVYPGCCEIGPSPSGACGWGVLTNDHTLTLNTVASDGSGNCPDTPCISISGGSDILSDRCDCSIALGGSTVSGSFSTTPNTSCGARAIMLDTVAQFIKFSTTQNIGCLEDGCFDLDTQARAATATVDDSWDCQAPQGTVVVRFTDGNAGCGDLSCMKGVGDCSGPLTVYRGIAVLNRQASSDAICQEGCRDESTCGKWVYDVIDADMGLTFTDLCCTGNVRDGYDRIQACDLAFGTGLRLTNTDCGMRVDSNHRIIDTNCCLTPESGYARIVNSKSYEVLNLGAGLWVTQGDALDCNLAFTDACDNDDCLLNVFAGFRPINTPDGCFDEDDALTSDGTRFINVVDFQGGLRAINGPNSCDLLLRAGFEIKSSGGCLQTGAAPDSSKLNHILHLHDGLRATDSDANDCEIEIGAGLAFVNDTGCFCDASGDDVDFASRILIGKGLQVQQGDTSCEAKIGLCMDVNGYKVAELTFGDGLTVTQQGDCGVLIEAPSGGGGGSGCGEIWETTPDPIELVTGISCSGSGAEATIILDTVFLHFNTCGQYIGISTDGSL